MARTRVPRKGTSRAQAPADLESALSALGIEIRRGDEHELTGMCPMHVKRTGKQDRHPSWSVNRATGLHNCFSCGYRGSFMTLVMDLKFKNDSFRAARWIRQFGVDLQAAVDALPSWDERRDAIDVDNPDLDLAGRLASYEDPPDWALKKRRLLLCSAQHYGVRWDEWRQCWVLPIRRPVDNAVLGWQVKSADGRVFRNFPAGVAKGECLFGFDVFPDGAPAVVLESPLDVVRLHTVGIQGGVSTYGAEWTEAQMRLLLDRTDTLIAAFDNDKGGRMANELLLYGDPRSGRRAWTNRIGLKFLNYDGISVKDIGDMRENQIKRAYEDAQHWTALVTAPLRVGGR